MNNDLNPLPAGEAVAKYAIRIMALEDIFDGHIFGEYSAITMKEKLAAELESLVTEQTAPLQEELHALRTWKAEALELWGPLMDYGQSKASGLKPGESISKAALKAWKVLNAVSAGHNSEALLLLTVHHLCIPSLSPDVFAMWEEVVRALYKVRSALKGQEMPQGIDNQPINNNLSI